MMFVNPKGSYPAVISSELPTELQHLDSDLCWCDPIIEIDAEGRKLVLHRQVTWN